MPDVTATDIFTLGTGFYAQSSRTRYNKNRVKVLSATGNGVCSAVNEKTIEVTCSYEKCTGEAADLSIAIGDEVGGYLVTQVVVSEEAGEFPKVEVTGISYPSGTVTPWAYTITETLAFGVTSSISEADPTSRTRTWAINNVITAKTSSGEIAYAQATDATLEIQEDGVGAVVDPPVAAGFDAVEYENSDENSDFDTYSARMVQDLTLATPA